MGRGWWGRRGRRDIDWCRARLAEVTASGAELGRRSDADLRALSEAMRQQAATGTPLDGLLPEAFAAVREAARRVYGRWPTDAQVMAGAAMHLGAVAELAAGAGRTLAIAFPAYLNALPGSGVHVMTRDQRLAERDAGRLRALYEFLGLRVGVVRDGDDGAARRAAYAAHVTYGAESEIGHDYLRDHLAWDLGECVQRGLRCAIADDADRTLLGAARASRVISAPEPPGDAGGADAAARRVTLARITVRERLRRYEKLAAITGRARADEEEYAEGYGLDVVAIPVAGPPVRDDAVRPQEREDAASRWYGYRFDDVEGEQRDRVYDYRRAVLERAVVPERVRAMLDQVVETRVEGAATGGALDAPALGRLRADLGEFFPISDAAVEPAGGGGSPARAVTERLRADAHAAYERREWELGTEAMRELEVRVALSMIDRSWRKHLAELDRLYDEVCGDRFAGTDRLAAFQRMGADRFAAMWRDIETDVIGYLFHLEIEAAD